MTEDEMVGWHHRLSGHEFDPGDSQSLCQSPGLGSLMWGLRTFTTVGALELSAVPPRGRSGRVESDPSPSEAQTLGPSPQGRERPSPFCRVPSSGVALTCVCGHVCTGLQSEACPAHSPAPPGQQRDGPNPARTEAPACEFKCCPHVRGSHPASRSMGLTPGTHSGSRSQDSRRFRRSSHLPQAMGSKRGPVGA